MSLPSLRSLTLCRRKVRTKKSDDERTASQLAIASMQDSTVTADCFSLIELISSSIFTKS